MSFKSFFCSHEVTLLAGHLDKDVLTWHCGKCNKAFVRSPDKKLKWARTDLSEEASAAWAIHSDRQRKYHKGYWETSDVSN